MRHVSSGNRTSGDDHDRPSPHSPSVEAASLGDLPVVLFDLDPDFRAAIQRMFGRHLSERQWRGVTVDERLRVYRDHYRQLPETLAEPSPHLAVARRVAALADDNADTDPTTLPGM